MRWPVVRQSHGLRRAIGSLVAAVLLVAAVEPAFDAQPARELSLEGHGQPAPVYLVGSVHLLTKDYYPLGPALDGGLQGLRPARRGSGPRRAGSARLAVQDC